MHQTRRSDPRRAKVRDMGRSVLPSTARRSAKVDLNSVRRSTRRRNHVAVADLIKQPCYCEYDEGCPRCDADAYVPPLTSLMKEAVYDRRAHDKIAPIVRWAKAEIADIDDIEQRRRHLRSVLPDGVIGWHAMTHLEYDAVDPEGLTRIRWYHPTRSVAPSALRSLATHALENGYHAAFNHRTHYLTAMEWNPNAPEPVDGIGGRVWSLVSAWSQRTKAERKLADADRPNRWTVTDFHDYKSVRDDSGLLHSVRVSMKRAWRPLTGIEDIDSWMTNLTTTSLREDVVKWGHSIGWVEPQPEGVPSS